MIIGFNKMKKHRTDIDTVRCCTYTLCQAKAIDTKQKIIYTPATR